jgi:hypothetical protein
MAKPKPAAVRLEQARADHADANRTIGDLEAKRHAALLADDDATAAKLDAELDQLRRLARGHRDKIALLEAEAANEENARRLKEKEGLIRRIEAKLAERDRIGAELQARIPEIHKLFLRMIELGREIDAAWPWPVSDRLSIMLPRESISAAISHELYRMTATPFLGGGQEEPDAGLKFPGAKPPHLGLMGLPSAIPPMVTVLAQASEHASNVMRGRAVAAPAATVAATNSGALASNGPAALKLSGLLARQAELAALVAPTRDQDREYGEIVQQIAIAETQLKEERAIV